LAGIQRQILSSEYRPPRSGDRPLPVVMQEADFSAFVSRSVGLAGARCGYWMHGLVPWAV